MESTAEQNPADAAIWPSFQSLGWAEPTARIVPGDKFNLIRRPLRRCVSSPLDGL